MKIPLSSVIFREDLYPRIKTDPLTVQKYAEDLDVLPPIEVNQRYELIDGWHRWTAHKKQQSETIEATVIQTSSDSHLLELAIERNASHGLQLSQEDKQNMARRIYNVTPERERDAKKKQLAKVLSVSERTIREWLSRIDKDSKAARNKRIFEAWMACQTQDEIAERENVAKSVTPFNEWIRECRELESTEFRICVTDVDLVVHRFSARNEKQRQSGSIKSIVDHIMMVEVKTNGRPTPFAQADTFGLLDQIMRKATVHNGRRWPIKVDDLRQPGRVRRVRWLGFHILCLDGIRPDDGFGIRWDSHSIPSVNILVEILRMDRDPDDPSRQLDTRRHHSIKPVQLPLLDNQGEAA